jgi:endonuclease/exonuclease/phosphatase family metal-dependent hydrolase
VIVWIIKLKKQALLSIFIILLGWFHFQKIFVFNNVKHQYGDGLKVMSYNVMQFYSKEDVRRSTYNDINEFVEKVQPDLLCLQEAKISNKLLFPSFPYQTDKIVSAELKTVILSKYPIINKKYFGFGEGSNNSAVYADIVIKNDTVRLFSIHFESLNLNSIIENKRQLPKERLLRKLGKTFTRQIKQYQILKPFIENSPYPVIIGADMNNTALSYLYRELTQLDLKDTFLESGTNYGKTYDLNILPVRIDMILIEKTLKSSNFENFGVNHSDHYPIMTEIHL